MPQKPLLVHRRRLLYLLAPVLAVAFALMLARPAFAAVVTNTTEPISATIVNPCNGEVVPFTGEFHDVFRVTLNGSGGSQVGVHENEYATGVGSLGNKYELNATANEVFNVNVGEEETLTEINLVVSQGSAPNFIEKGTFNFIVNPDGTVTSSHAFFDADCQG